MQVVTWTVLHGNWLGQTIGFPTANIFYNDSQLTNGTRRYNVVYNEKIYPALGPYFPERQLLEAHLLDFHGDLYDKEIVVYPLQKIRENEKFDEFYQLGRQIEKDIAWVHGHTITMMTFGTFDRIHPGHEAYLTQARCRWDKLITVIARDQMVKQLKGKPPVNNEQNRLQQVAEKNIANLVILGNKQNPYQCLLDHQPDIICLGYDQHSFDGGLQDFYNWQNLPIPQIVRLDAFEPEKYKSSLFTDTTIEYNKESSR